MPDQQEVSAPKRGGQTTNKKSRGWLAALLVLGLGAVVVFFWLRPERSTSASESAASEATLALEPFIVNLDGSGQRAYLRVGITLALAHPLPRHQREGAPIALVRDCILSVLATAQPDQLLTVEGKRQLKNGLLKALEERAPQLAVQDVYFTEFLVQM
ncbi:MAG: flagellar basal body-associated FliL family protein [Terriglobales bacterium]|jgi:flagellar basal body-associated protein FliL